MGVAATIAAAMLDPARVADAFALGRPQGPPAPVPGAWSNRLWRLETELGQFAVKELRGSVEAETAGWSQRLRVAMAVERAAWAAGTILMAEPLVATGSGGWLAEVATAGERRATVRCHHWVQGVPATAVAPSSAMAADVGRSLAAIHTLGLAAPGTTATGLAPLSFAAWRQTVTQTRQAGLPWAGELADLTPLVDQLTQRLRALRREGRPMLLSHRDLDPKNAVVRPDRRVALLDWDYAGPTLAASELLVTALSFAGGATEPDTACIRAFVQAYLGAGGQVEPPDLLDTAPIHQEGLSWLWLNVDRCLGRRVQDQADRQLAHRLAPQLIRSFAAELETIDRWASRLLEQQGQSG
jgi:Ser/Thr protein kinase RdoA (MazF antagonist)